MSTRNGVTCHFHSFQENGRASVRMTRASAAVEIFLWFAAAQPLCLDRPAVTIRELVSSLRIGPRPQQAKPSNV